MSATLTAIRQKYPAYADVPDDKLARAIGDKYPVYLARDPAFKAEYEKAAPFVEPPPELGSALKATPESEAMWKERDEASVQATKESALEHVGISPEGIQMAKDYAVGKLPKSIQPAVSAGLAPTVALDKTLTGIADWATSASGAAQLAAANIPVVRIPMVMKWFHDMAKGGGQSASDAIDRWKAGDYQGFADSVAAMAFNLVGAGLVGSGGVKMTKADVARLKPTVPARIKESAPATAQALQKTLDQPPVTGKELPVPKWQEAAPAKPAQTEPLDQRAAYIREQGATTKEQIQQLFAQRGIKLSREEAAALRDKAWPKETITAAAVKDQTGQPQYGANHPEVEKRLGMPETTAEQRNTPQYGFQTSQRPFITREEAGPVATAAGQDLKDFEPGEPVHSDEVAAKPGGTTPISEISQPGEGKNVYGVRQETREKMASAGQATVTEPGEGRTLEQTIDEGRTILQQNPAAADAAETEFRKTGRFSYPDFAAVRAKLEEVRRSGHRIEEQLGMDSPDYHNIREQTWRWDRLAKDMQTAWHQTGMAQHGEQDIDTGSVLGLETAYGQEFTPAQRTEAKTRVDKQKETAARVNNAFQDWAGRMDLAFMKDVPVKIPDSVGEAQKLFTAVGDTHRGVDAAKWPFTPKQIQLIWKYARKFYIDNGEADPKDVPYKVADDLGLDPADVRRAFEAPKNARQLSDQMWRAMSDRHRAVSDARRWLEEQKYPKLMQVLRKYPRFRFGAKIFGHAFVPFGTHAELELMDPMNYPRLVSDYQEMAKAAFDKGYHERMMQDLAHAPRYDFWRRHGAQIDVSKITEEYGEPGVTTRIMTGSRSFDILKVLRYQKLERDWLKTNAGERTDQWAKELSSMANHATGTTRTLPVAGKLGRNLQWIMFAPRLVASRFAYIYGEPLRATSIYVRRGLGGGKNVTPEEMMFANKTYQRRAKIAAVYLGYLALNQSYLAATGSGQKVNFFNPLRSDWLAMKGFGKEVRPLGGLMTLVRDSIALLVTPFVPEKKFQQLIGGYGSKESDIPLFYARSSLSPAASDIPDILTGKTILGDYLPDIPGLQSTHQFPMKYEQRQGKVKLTKTQFIAQQLAPIPVEDVVMPATRIIHDEFSHQGVSPEDTRQFISGLKTSAFRGLTGVFISADPYIQRNDQIEDNLLKTK